MKAPLDLVALIHEASTDPSLREGAIARWAAIADRLFERNKERNGVRVSDCGRCVRELWADIHGKLDLPVTGDTQISRFDIGTLYGAWLACLCAAALNKYQPEWALVVEAEIEFGGIPGHADLMVFDNGRGYWAIEFKSTYGAWAGALDAPDEKKRYQVLQTAAYAIATKAHMFSIVTIAPAARGKKMAQYDYDPDEFAVEVHNEFLRLMTATQDDAPVGDAEEKWRCTSCRFTNCERNPQQIAAFEAHAESVG